jgi:hypothetical protein
LIKGYDLVVPRSKQRIVSGFFCLALYEFFGGRSITSIAALAVLGFSAGYVTVALIQRGAAPPEVTAAL